MDWLLASLFVGHFAGDFALQPRSLVKRKGNGNVLLEHGMLLWAAHLLAAFPFLDARIGLVLLAVVAVHVCIDFTKIWLKYVIDAPKSLFVADQFLHVLTLLVAWLALGETSGPNWAAGYVIFGAVATVICGAIVWRPVHR